EIGSGDALGWGGGFVGGGGALTPGRGVLATGPSQRATRRGRADACTAYPRWGGLDECREPPNIPPATTPSTTPRPNLSRASAPEGTARDKATTPRMGIVLGCMTVLRPIAAPDYPAEFGKVPHLRTRSGCCARAASGHAAAAP